MVLDTAEELGARVNPVSAFVLGYRSMGVNYAHEISYSDRDRVIADADFAHELMTGRKASDAALNRWFNARLSRLRREDEEIDEIAAPLLRHGSAPEKTAYYLGAVLHPLSLPYCLMFFESMDH